MSGFTVTSTVDAIALGNFDGMHLGHRALFSRLGAHGAVCVIEHYRATLTPHIYRARFAKEPLFFYDLDRIRKMEPETFLEKLHCDFPSLRRIVVGEDFHFGSGRSADVKRLESLFNGEVVAVPEVAVAGEPVHSRFIRAHIEKGEIERANLLLGRPYEVWGDTVAGQGLGKEKLVPTVNLETGRFLLPEAGVYKTDTCIEGEWVASVTFVGHRHTADGSFAVETHVIRKNIGDVRGKIGVRWFRRLRGNRKFDSLSELKKQIEKDIEAAGEKR
ncbi:bifunctional riboflavin kinase/FAD synthetase [Hydrogenimonas sp.]